LAAKDGNSKLADMDRKILFIEGTQDRSNGTLRQGFHKLLRQLLKGNMPRIIMGNGKSQAIKKFKKNKLSPMGYLLIDLDAEKTQKELSLEQAGLLHHKDMVFFMIQEMEAWFISQPAILDAYYNKPISASLPKAPPQNIADPATLLKRMTKDTQKGTYHKVKHGTALLELLDAHVLRTAFAEFDAMIRKIASD